MGYERHVRLFRNGRNQAVRIPREFELPGEDAVMRKEGDKLIIEPAPRKSLLALLATLKPIEDEFGEIEDLPPDLVRHARSGVGDLELDIAARREAEGMGQVPAANLDHLRLDLHLAALGQDIPGIGDQVQDHLLHLRRVDADAVEVGIELHPQLDMVPQDAPQLVVQIGQHGVELQQLRLQHLPAAEGQELAGEGRAPLADPFDLPQVFARRIVGRQPECRPVLIGNPVSRSRTRVAPAASGDSRQVTRRTSTGRPFS